MKKFSKVLFSLLVLGMFCFVVSCKTGTENPEDNDDDKPVELRKALDKIEVDTSNVKTEYYLGQAFDSTGLKVEAKFTNKTSEDVSSSVVINKDSFDANALGEYLIVVSYTYEGRVRTDKYTVVVKTILEHDIKHVVGLDIVTDPVNKEFSYDIGADYDLGEIKFVAVYSDETTVELEASEVTKDDSGVDKTQAGHYSVVFSITGSYTYEGVTEQVVVKNFILITYLNPVTSIKFVSGTKEFEYGSTFTTEDWVIEATYANEEVATIPYGKYKTNDINTNLSGENTVTVTYTEMNVTKTCNVVVTVKPDPDANRGLNIVLNANDVELMSAITEDHVINSYFTIKASSSTQSKVDANSKVYEPLDLSFNRRINLNGKYSATRNLEIIMPKAGTIKVVFSQGNAGRKLSLYKNGAAIQTSTAATVNNDTLVEHTFSVDEGGVYQLGCSDGGIYIWYIALGEPLED